MSKVTVVVPKAFQLRLADQSVLKILAGVQELEAELADHWYAKANGVTRYEKAAADAPPPIPAAVIPPDAPPVDSPEPPPAAPDVPPEAAAPDAPTARRGKGK